MPVAGSGDRWDALTVIALLALTIVGAVIRSKGFSSTGLYQDDAREALSSRVGIGTAWHMWVAHRWHDVPGI